MTWKRTILSLAAACAVALPAAADWDAGVAAFKAGDLARAESEFRALAETQPDRPEGHLMLGQTLLAGGRTSEALAPLGRARELAPGDFQAAFALGQAQIKLKRFAEAAKALSGLDPAALPEPQRLAFYRSRIAAFTGSGNPARALPDLEAALALEPDDAGMHRQLAQTAKAAGRADVAATHYQRAAQLDPSDGASVASLVELLYNRAIQADDSRRPDLCGEVLPHARRLLQLDESLDHLLLMSKVATCADMDELARDTLKVAVAAHPHDWRARYALGKAQLELKAWTEARAAFEDALAKKVPAGEKGAVQGRLGYVFEKLGKPAEALELYRLAGDAEAIARVEQNVRADEEQARIDALTAEKARLERELAELQKKGSGL